MCTIQTIDTSDEHFEKLMNGEDLKYWIVSESGDISSSSNEDIGPFYVPAENLTKTNWLTHFIKKPFPVDGERIKEEFYTAYLWALKNAGCKFIEIDIDGITVKSVNRHE